MRGSRRRGFSLIELLIVISIILVIVTVALPRFINAQMFARETAAIKAIQTIHSAQVQYNSEYGRFAASLTELGPPASGGPTAAAASLIGNDLAGGEKGQYRFTMTANESGYAINAIPLHYGSSGSRSFYSDQNMLLRENDGPEPATTNSKESRM